MSDDNNIAIVQWTCPLCGGVCENRYMWALDIAGVNIRAQYDMTDCCRVIVGFVVFDDNLPVYVGSFRNVGEFRAWALSAGSTGNWVTPAGASWDVERQDFKWRHGVDEIPF